MGSEASNGSCSDAVTLLVGDWLFYVGGGTYLAILGAPISPIHSNASKLPWFYSHLKHNSFLKGVEETLNTL